jgi:eukaryotic-like serine/threonine-protein kinase
MEPSQQHAEIVQQCASRFHAAPKARLRRAILRGFLGVAGVLVFLALSPLGGLVAAAAVLGIVLVAMASYFVVSGAMGATHLFARFRELALGASLRLWLKGFGVLLLLLLVLWLLGVLWLWLAACAVAVAAAVALYYLVDRPIAQARAASIAHVQELLRELRQSGQDDAQLQGLVARYAGPRWEEFFEALFGYDAKLAARRQWGTDDDGRRRKRFRPWRDPIVRWIDGRIQVRREAHQRRHIQEVEERALRAQGVSPEEARRRAADVARAIVYRAAMSGGAPHSAPYFAPGEYAGGTSAAREFTGGPSSVEELAGKPDTAGGLTPGGEGGGLLGALGSIVHAVFALLFGQRMRLLLGCLLLAGCALWADQNEVLRQPTQDDFQQAWQEMQDLVAAAREDRGAGFLDAVNQLAPERSADYAPLELAWLPPAVSRSFSSYNPGIAGLVLVLSALVPGLKIAAFIFPAVFVMLLAHATVIPGVIAPAGNSLTSLVMGLLFVMAGYIWGRE